LAHKIARHGVGDEGEGDFKLFKLPGSDAGTLEEGAGLGGDDLELLAPLVCLPDYP